MNNTVLIGRLTRDPEIKYLDSGTANTTFTLAVDKGLSKEKKEQAEKYGNSTADFIRIIVWGKQAENAANYLVKGQLVGVQGRIQTGSYDDKDGKKVYTTEITANQVEFLEFGDKKQEDFQAPDGFNSSSNDDIPF